ncbi:integral membrane protein [Colletotrichum incanum]|nr:integral membrane protein [Colletotrichum incanum]
MPEASMPRTATDWHERWASSLHTHICSASRLCTSLVSRAIFLRNGPDLDLGTSVVYWGRILCLHKGTIAGLGKHVWALPVNTQQASRRIKLVISATLSYQITFIVIKMAFLFQFRRVFVLPKFVLFCDIMLGFIGIFGIAVVVSSIIFNTARWRGEANARERYDQGAWWLATASVHLVTDLIIFFMPIPMLNMLKLKRMQKAALFVSFGLGFVTTCISVVRMSTLPHVFTKDVTWDVIPALVWSEVELCCAVVCLCIPTLRPLLHIKKLTRTQYSYARQTSRASVKARFNRKTFNGGTFGSHSQQSLPSPMFMDSEPGMELSTEPKTPSSEPFNENGLTIMADVSPALTAEESDDGSEEFGPVDVEVATPLSPPPQCYVSPARLLPRSRPLSESTIEE